MLAQVGEAEYLDMLCLSTTRAHIIYTEKVDVWMWLNNKVAMYAGKEKIELAGAGIGT
jgi:hypothetical protein